MSKESKLPTHEQLKKALSDVVAAKGAGGFDLHMWGTIVNRDGIVHAVVFTGNDRGAQWPGSRIISAQKAYTANAFSLPGLALATANLYTAVQPGGSLFGLQHSNPVNPTIVYGGCERYGQPDDPMISNIPGGINVFGGGLALYNADGELLGAIGVSGDTSLADHVIAWRTRKTLGLDFVPAGVGQNGTDNMVFQDGWAHPAWSLESTAIIQALVTDYPVSKRVAAAAAVAEET